jgi:hypothetical protein
MSKKQVKIQTIVKNYYFSQGMPNICIHEAGHMMMANHLWPEQEVWYAYAENGLQCVDTGDFPLPTDEHGWRKEVRFLLGGIVAELVTMGYATQIREGILGLAVKYGAMDEPNDLTKAIKLAQEHCKAPMPNVLCDEAVLAAWYFEHHRYELTYEAAIAGSFFDHNNYSDFLKHLIKKGDPKELAKITHDLDKEVVNKILEK